MAKQYTALGAVDQEKKKNTGLTQGNAVSRGKIYDVAQFGSTMPSGMDGQNGPEYYGGHAIPAKKPEGPVTTYTGGSGSSTSSEPTPQKWDTTTPASLLGDPSNPELQAAYNQAMQNLQNAQNNKPTWNGSLYDAQIQSLYQQIMGHGPFKYDSATDPLYQQYKQDYAQGGQTAMRDTMGQAAALTGGYGSSYAQSVGQQQYNEYLQKLANVLPETYSAALSAYNAEGDRLNDLLTTTTGLADTEYQQYLDALSQYNTDVNFLADQADTAHEHMTDAENTAWDHMQDLTTAQQNWYNQLYTLMQAGYKPTKEEANAAGLSQAQAMWLFNYIQEQQAE